jgi:predicted TIM-barrel fold metal-dependent hydrolase
MLLHDYLEQRSLLDHHCHGVVKDDLTWPVFTSMLTEGDTAHAGQELNTPLGLAVRAYCAPLLGLERHSLAGEYWQRRMELGNVESSQLLLNASGVDMYVVDTGYRGSELTSPKELEELARRPVETIVRLEMLAEEIVTHQSAEDFPDAFRAALAQRSQDCIGFKSVIAYRYGLHFDPTPPTDGEVVLACSAWLREIESTGSERVSDPVLLRFFLWQAVRHGKPIQMHIGYGDKDITLYRCDPSQMTAFLRATEDTGATIVLLHCYPYVRQAAILCQVFSHVYMDTSLGVAHSGAGSRSIIRESLEIVPFSRLLYASDAFGIAELYFLGAQLWRIGIDAVLSDMLNSHDISMPDAQALIDDLAWNNAARLYGLERGEA